MRSLLVVVLCLGLLAISAAKKKKDEKWDELEGLLKDVHAVDDDADPLDQDQEDSAEAAPTVNPCEEHHCGWGKECVVTAKNKPSCECVSECPEMTDADEFDQVCSNQNETYATICHLYRERCLCKRNEDGCAETKHKHVHLEYLGPCKELDTCTDEHMAQFPERMADWLFQVMREMKKREELHGDDWPQLLDEAESDDALKHVYPVIWKYCELDKSNDKTVTHHELIPLTAPVIAMESCIKPFIRRCDANDDERISLAEWGKCLGLQEEEIVERC